MRRTSQWVEIKIIMIEKVPAPSLVKPAIKFPVVPVVLTHILASRTEG